MVARLQERDGVLGEPVACWCGRLLGGFETSESYAEPNTTRVVLAVSDVTDDVRHGGEVTGFEVDLSRRAGAGIGHDRVRRTAALKSVALEAKRRRPLDAATGEIELIGATEMMVIDRVPAVSPQDTVSV